MLLLGMPVCEGWVRRCEGVRGGVCEGWVRRGCEGVRCVRGI